MLSQQIDGNVRKHYITTTFVTHLVTLFDSIDPRERECLKTVTHRIYGKLTNRRAAIRRAINYSFYQFLYETHSHRGVSELLEILASIINGFTVPIRPEHKVSLERSLIPLHKMRQYEDYNVQLSYCMTLYVMKDPTLSQPVGKARWVDRRSSWRCCATGPRATPGRSSCSSTSWRTCLSRSSRTTCVVT